MNFVKRERKLNAGAVMATVVTLVALIIIGCGGSGGGGSSTGTTVTTATATATTATATATTATATTATATATTATATATTATATATTSTSTTSGSGVLPQNVIIYAASPATNSGVGTTYNVNSIPPTGGTPTVIASGVSTTISLFALNPVTAKQYIFAAANASDTVGIYSNSSLSITGAKTIVTPSYVVVISLSITQDGTNIVYTAQDALGNGTLYSIPIAGGSPLALDSSYGSAVSTANPDQIIYVKVASLYNQVYTRSLKAGAAGAATQLTTDNTSDKYGPTISRDGTQFAYQSTNEASGTLGQNVVVGTIGTASLVTLPNTKNYEIISEAFNSDGTSVAVLGEDSSSFLDLYTQPVSSTGAINPLITSSATLLAAPGLYWTSSTGRGIGGGLFNSLSRRHLVRHH